MPELPEVEIAARNLRAWTAGRRIVSIESDAAARRLFRPASPSAFSLALEGARFREVRRKGKQLLVRLEKGREPAGLLAHLGMTGKWLRRTDAPRRGALARERGAGRGAAGGEPPRFSRVRFRLDDGAVLHFVDLRLFGRLRAVPGARFEEVREIAALGPDPLEDGIDPVRLLAGLARSRLPVKVRLLDQRLLPGVGNIQASEALFRARIDPRRRSDAIALPEARALARAILASVRESIAREEGPEIAYVEEAGAENPFLVYAREGERCPRCRRARIERLVQAQRSTFFCPRCQPLG